MSNLFDKDTVIDPDKDYRAELVGEGKKYRDDAALARSRVEADVHIAKLEDQLQSFRDELQKRSTVEDVLKKITEAGKGAQASEGNQPPVSDRPKEVDINQLETKVAELVANKVAAAEAERNAQANVTAVRKTLKELWGDGYQDRLTQVSKDLGIGQEFMNSVASSNPAAFLQLVGANTTARKSGAGPLDITPSGINSAALQRTQHTGEKTLSYYEALKLKDPKSYERDLKAMHAEQYAQAMKLGEAYFDK